MAIIQNGFSLFTGDAGSGQSEIRRYLNENDRLDAIVQLPNDSFYNTGIATYVWIITKDKPEDHAGRVQLMDASNRTFYEYKRGEPADEIAKRIEAHEKSLMPKLHELFGEEG